MIYTRYFRLVARRTHAFGDISSAKCFFLLFSFLEFICLFPHYGSERDVILEWFSFAECVLWPQQQQQQQMYRNDRVHTIATAMAWYHDFGGQNCMNKQRISFMPIHTEKWAHPQRIGFSEANFPFEANMHMQDPRFVLYTISSGSAQR